VQDRSALGFNYIQMSVIPGQPLSDLLNEGGPAFLSSNPDHLNSDFWQAFDKRIVYANERGIVVGLMLAPGNAGWQAFSSPDQVARFVQYLVNRYAAFNVIWLTSGETAVAGTSAGGKVLGEYVRELDPFDNPIVASATSVSGGAWSAAIYKTTERSIPEASNQWLGKPVINAAFGNQAIRFDDERLEPLWEATMRGEFVVIGGGATNLLDLKMNEDQMLSESLAHLKILKDFWTSDLYHVIPWWEFTRFESLGKSRWLAGAPGVAYVVYVGKSGGFKIDLSDARGEIRGEWFNTRTGLWSTAFSGAASSSFSLKPPDSGYAAYLWVYPSRQTNPQSQE